MSASSRLSPTANLLRSSRVFALPKPLAPALNNASSSAAAHSDTATSPYPTHAAIETHREARNIGDWGLKRPLPLKSTAGRDASYVRIRDGIDTREHIVDFEQAGDHVWTLRKFQALNIPVLFPRNNPGDFAGGSLSSPFENQYLSTEKPKNLSKDAKRWRTQGPWIAGMTNSEFERWLYGGNEDAGAVGKKSDLLRFLQRTMLKDDHQLIRILEEILDLARAHGSMESTYQAGLSVQKFLDEVKEAGSSSLAQAIVNIVHDAPVEETKASVRHWLEDLYKKTKANRSVENTSRKSLGELLEAAFRRYVITLRARPEEFLPLLQSYFDLPDTPQNTTEPVWTFRHESGNGSHEAATAEYKMSGMPTTHPSAGLGYLRLGDAIAENHELYGPQKEQEAVPVRLLRAGRPHAMDRSNHPMFGIAGFVSDQHRILGDNSIKEFRPVPGGQKYALRPTYVSISPEGRPIVEARPTGHDKQVMAGLVKEVSIEEYRGKHQIKSFDSMPPLDDDYDGRRTKVNNAVQKTRDGLRNLTNQQRVSSPRDGLNPTGASAVSNILDSLDHP